MSSKGGVKQVLIGCAFMLAGGLLVICLGLAWFGYTLYQNDGLADMPSGAIRVGEKAPDFTLVDNSGSEHRLSSYAGKVVLLNFWTTWCGPCEAEMPDIERVSARYTKDVVTLAVNCEGSAAQVAAYAKKHSLTFPLLLDHDGTVSETYFVRAFPTSVIVDRQGIIREIRVGSLDEEQFVGMLTEAIAAAPRENPTPTAAPTATPAAKAVVVLEGCVTTATLNVREGPGKEFKVYRGLSRGECEHFDARSGDTGWLRLADLKTNTAGRLWVSAQFIDLKGSAGDLPVE